MPDPASTPPDPIPPAMPFRLRTASDFPVVNAPASTPSSQGPTDVRELFRLAQPSAQASGASRATPATNEVHEILRDNLARADAAGLNTVTLPPKRRSRRRRDYLITTLIVNALLVVPPSIFHGNIVVTVFTFSGFVLFNIGIAWTFFVVLDDY